MREPFTLPDVQLERDSRGVELQAVGVRQLLIPLKLQRGAKSHTVTANASLSVSLSAELKGIHMSRLVELLTELSRTELDDLNLSTTLREAMRRLQARAAQSWITFTHFIERSAPVSGLTAPMGYTWHLAGRSQEPRDGEPESELVLGVDLPMANLCPCSKAISEYGAHNQRGMLRVRVRLDSAHRYSVEWLEELTLALENAGSSPVFPVLKRQDEKFVTERQYDNPKFVEDVVRDAVTVLKEQKLLLGFKVEAEAYESIHAHNAWAACQHNFPAHLIPNL